MSFNKKYTNASSVMPAQKVVKPYCKVCHDAGKLESEYTSHFVKSEPGHMGVVVCPTLLNQKCRFCDKLGHTVSRCPDIANINKKQEILQKNEQKQFKKKEFIKTTEKPKAIANHNHNSKFAALDEDEYEEEKKAEAPLTILVDFPRLSFRTDSPEIPFRPASPSGPPPPIVSHPIVSHPIVSWATVVSTPAKPVLSRQVPIIRPVEMQQQPQQKLVTKRWADDWSSEEEDTYDANNNYEEEDDTNDW